MARRWTEEEERRHRAELVQLYIDQNKTISEIGRHLRISEQGAYDRLLRLGIPTARHLKKSFNNLRSDIRIPGRSTQLAELFGILLGDGHVGRFQVVVTLGTKELAYAAYVRRLINTLFAAAPRITTTRRGHRTVYLGSTLVTQWLRAEGLAQNKVAAQADAPEWIRLQREYYAPFVRGFFDTDGSVYGLRYGIQISFTNRSSPLLASLHRMASELGYKPSAICGYVFYVTRHDLVERFFREIRPANPKHIRRFKQIMRRWQSSKCTRL